MPRCFHQREELLLAGKLQRLVFESSRRVVREKKPLEFFTCNAKPRPSRYNGTIPVLKKLVGFLRRVELFRLQLGRNKKEESFRCLRSFAIAEWKLWRSGKWAVGFGIQTANS